MSTRTETATSASTPLSIEKFTLLIDTSLQNKENVEAISDRLAIALESKGVNDTALNSIRNLSKNVKEINEMFIKIAQGFVEFDNARFLDLQGNVLRLGDQWSAFHRRFQTLIDKSFDNASAASAFMKQYTEVLLTDVPADARQELRVELGNFVKQLKQKADDALLAKGDFARLAEDMKIFTKVLEETLKKANTRVAADLQQVRDRIGTLTGQLKEVTEKIHKMSEACMSCFGAGASSVGGVFAWLSPKSIWAAITEVFTHEQENLRKELENAKGEETRLKSELLEAEVRLAELVAKEQLLAKYMGSLEGTKKDIEGLAGKIDAIAHIWQCLRADMVSLDTQLDSAVDPTAPLTFLFMKKIKVTRALYVKIAFMLEMYAKGNDSDAS
ncbi:hypothetical protein PYCCODRAFT_1465854 [Trametes coccinea BRFM310]|uniref:Uncharacterized protein n=1 Tax=Trametes coccinea (strain BRFM310) TaxID=1353009 RepID=A0A1Y2IUT5_TRAC3|nr:hypothetical protein PYCCODRAFT_1465854 [Trametes coccinea BRFM310]